jgi:hypothetical protein
LDLSIQLISPGGRLASFIQNWVKITQDPVILDIVRGHRMDFISPPVQFLGPHWPQFSKKETLQLTEEIQKLMEKGAVEVAPETETGFLGHLFLRQKKDGSYRPIFNLKMLNVFIRYQHFKMENLSSLVGLLQHQDWMCKIDLKDAFFCVKICPTHRKFLRFIWQGKMMQFCSLPFGLASAPRTFTKVLKPVMALLRRVGLKVVIYLDDLLLMNQSQQGLIKDRDSVL